MCVEALLERDGSKMQTRSSYMEVIGEIILNNRLPVNSNIRAGVEVAIRMSTRKFTSRSYCDGKKTGKMIPEFGLE